MAVPMTMAQILNLLYKYRSGYIGRIRQYNRADRRGNLFSIITLITAFTYLFGNGSPLCSMERGRRKPQKKQASYGNTFSIKLLTGVLMTLNIFL